MYDAEDVVYVVLDFASGGDLQDYFQVCAPHDDLYLQRS